MPAAAARLRSAWRRRGRARRSAGSFWRRRPRPSPCGDCPASASVRRVRAAAMAWSSPRMVIVHDHDPKVVRRDAGEAEARRIWRSHNPRNRRRPLLKVTSGEVQTSISPYCARSLMGLMARLMARLISPSRARPSRARAASTMASSFSAAGDTQPSRSPSHSASCTISSSRRRCTPSHLSLHSAAGKRRGRQPERLGRISPSQDSAMPVLHRAAPNTALPPSGRTPVRTRQAARKHDRAPCVQLTEKPHLTPHVRASAGALGLHVTGSFRRGQDGRGCF